MTVIKPRLWRAGVLIPSGIGFGIFIAGAVAEFEADRPGQAVAALMGPVVFCLIIGFRTRSLRLEIGESVVLAKQGHWRGHPDKEAPRSDIRAVHYYPRIISFRGPDNKPIMMIDANYTVRQMAQVASLLGVRLFDHRRWDGIRRVDKGRLVYQPDSVPVAEAPE
jgi:hypothetical protein